MGLTYRARDSPPYPLWQGVFPNRLNPTTTRSSKHIQKCEKCTLLGRRQCDKARPIGGAIVKKGGLTVADSVEDGEETLGRSVCEIRVLLEEAPERHDARPLLVDVGLHSGLLVFRSRPNDRPLARHDERLPFFERHTRRRIVRDEPRCMTRLASITKNLGSGALRAQPRRAT